jgi:HEAT repeat protein
VIALGQIADPRAVQPLIREGLGSVSEPVRAAASDSLRAVGAPAVPALKAVAAARGPMHDGLAVGAPISAAGAQATAFTVAQRAGAVRALGGMKLPAATDAAVAALSDPEKSVREAAADALGSSGDPRVIGPLAARFTDSDPDGRVQSAAARSLAAFGPAAVPTLVAALSSHDTARSYWAGQGLLLVGHPSVAPLTALLAKADPSTAQLTAKLLGDLGDRSAAPALSAALQRNLGPEFQFAAQTALQRLSESAAGPSG